MPYMDIWMYNSRPRMKVFLCYLLIFIAFFIFSDVMIYCYNKSLYQPMRSYEVQAVSPEVTVTLAESSRANGNVKGTVKNNTNEVMLTKYLKFEFYTEHDIVAGTKYLQLGLLQPGEEKNYELGFRYNNVVSVKISEIDESEITNSTPEDFKVNPILPPVGIIGSILYLFL